MISFEKVFKKKGLDCVVGSRGQQQTLDVLAEVYTEVERSMSQFDVLESEEDNENVEELPFLDSTDDNHITPLNTTPSNISNSATDIIVNMPISSVAINNDHLTSVENIEDTTNILKHLSAAEIKLLLILTEEERDATTK